MSMCIWGLVCHEGVDNSVCYPKEKKACASREALVLHSSVDKVTDTIDKKFAGVATVEKPNSTNLRSECWVMGENHPESRDLTARL